MMLTVDATRSSGSPSPIAALRSTFLLLVAGVVVLWAARGTGADIGELLGAEGRARMLAFVREMFPPDLSPAHLAATVRPLLETIQISLLGTTLGILGAFPLSFLAVRRTFFRDPLRDADHPRHLLPDLPYVLSVFLMNVLRSVPELVWALLFIVAVGLGPFAGVLALAAHEVGTLGKLYSELFESVDPQSLEVLRASGGGRIQMFLYGMLPQAFPQLVSVTLYRWECITRTATILGFVGAGGIGQRIDFAIRLFQYDKLLTLILLSLLLVTAVNGISAVIRRKVM